MSLAIIAALPFVGAVLPGLAIGYGRNACALATGAVTALCMVVLAPMLPAVMAGEVVQAQIAWLPLLGLNAHFMLDGLGVLFALLILGIGLLIILYARFYLETADPMGRFYTYLLLFQGAMLGIVLSDNILLLLVFWELTSLSSFLLIGFWSRTAEGRQGARMALAVTGGGGLALMAGLLMLGQIAGSHDLSVILTKGDIVQASPLYLPALGLILLGAFTKSAQVPFQFWLPHAMAAPTPVSAYLHSATMVKAGLFLMARLWPVLAGTDAWFSIVVTTGLATMILAAAIALFQHDLKAVLAYSTVSHLGLITFLLGLGTPQSATAAMLHILCHASFKAALFMGVGIVDHAAHSRDLRRLGGLRHLMPVTFGMMTVAGLAMAGVPPLNGFLSKEAMLEQAAHSGVWVQVFATLGAALSVAYTLRMLVATFGGSVRQDYPGHPHDPGIGLWAAPAVLVAVVVASGLLPMVLLSGLVDVAAAAVTGAPVHAHLSLWHGVQSPALWMSVAAFGGGFALWGLHPRLALWWETAPRPDGKRGFDAVIAAAVRLARGMTDGAHDAAFSRFAAMAIVAIVTACLYAFAGGTHAPGSRPLTVTEFAPALAWGVLMAAVAGSVIWHRQRLLTLLVLGVVGLIISAGFAYLGAPDLALTQITVEVVTIILLLLALNFLPKETPRESTALRRLRDAAIAAMAGTGAAVLAFALMTRGPAFAPISSFHLAQSLPGAGGTNAVNTIIVDFRGFDTYGEIIVLGIAALLIFVIVEGLLSPGAANDRLLAFSPHRGDAGDRHPMMFVVATRIMLPFTMMVGVYLYLRGHNMPGGGFVAGLVFAIALVMQYIASGHGWTAGRQRVPYHGMIGAGVLIATATGLGSMAFGRPFLTSYFTHVHLPPLEDFELATAALFDLGVFLCVLGAVMLVLASLSRIGQRAGEVAAEAPYDGGPR